MRIFQSGVFKLFPWPMPSDWNKDISVVELKHDMVSDVRSRLVLLLGAHALLPPSVRAQILLGGGKVKTAKADCYVGVSGVTGSRVTCEDGSTCDADGAAAALG